MYPDRTYNERFTYIVNIILNIIVNIIVHNRIFFVKYNIKWKLSVALNKEASCIDSILCQKYYRREKD